VTFFEQVTNIYVRNNRKHLKVGIRGWFYFWGGGWHGHSSCDGSHFHEEQKAANGYQVLCSCRGREVGAVNAGGQQRVMRQRVQKRPEGRQLGWRWNITSTHTTQLPALRL
jgi:hypothetical protein